MNRYELLELELKLHNINVVDIPLTSSNSCCMKEPTKCIFINSNKNLNKIDRYWILAHEYEHFKNNLFYDKAEESTYIINQTERLVNEALITHYNLVGLVVPLLAKGLNKGQIQGFLGLSLEVLDETLFYIKRKSLKHIYYLLKGIKNEK